VDLSYDSVSSEEQARVRAQWDEDMKRRISELDLAQEFERQGLSWWELDEDGKVVRRGPIQPTSAG
jgi:hypothetical protein